MSEILPTAFTPHENSAIINVTDHLKHPTIIATMHSCGLRISEATHLHYDDISHTNMTIHVRDVKEWIDRHTILSRKKFDLVAEYWFK